MDTVRPWCRPPCRRSSTPQTGRPAPRRARARFATAGGVGPSLADAPSAPRVTVLFGSRCPQIGLPRPNSGSREHSRRGNHAPRWCRRSGPESPPSWPAHLRRSPHCQRPTHVRFRRLPDRHTPGKDNADSGDCAVVRCRRRDTFGCRKESHSFCGSGTDGCSKLLRFNFRRSCPRHLPRRCREEGRQWGEQMKLGARAIHSEGANDDKKAGRECGRPKRGEERRGGDVEAPQSFTATFARRVALSNRPT